MASTIDRMSPFIRALTKQLSEHIDVPVEAVRSWEATSDGESGVVAITLQLDSFTLTEQRFNEMREQAEQTAREEKMGLAE